MHDLPGLVAGFILAQIMNGAGDVRRHAEAPGGHQLTPALVFLDITGIMNRISLRIDDPWRDGVGGYAVLAELEGNRLGERKDPGLAGDIVRPLRLGAETITPGDMDDTAPACFLMAF